jgi:hypothetical protein
MKGGGMTRYYIIAAGVAAAVAVSFSYALAGSAHSSPRIAVRQTALEFFRSIDTRQYERACALLADGFFRRSQVKDRSLCALSLRIGFTWAPSYRVTIDSVLVRGDRAVVSARTNGVPGELVLVREAGLYKVLSVRGG